jgi:pyruvate,water dikinase
LNFDQITLADVPVAVGKNAALGQLFNALRPSGVNVVDGFAVTADAYHALLMHDYLEYKIRSLLTDLDIEDVNQLAARAQAVRTAILETSMPEAVASAILAAYDRLCERLGREPELAVRSSASAEDLPEACFAGQQETFLNVRGREALLRAVQAGFASLFTERAIIYCAHHGFDHFQVTLSVGVQPMVRSDKGLAKETQVFKAPTQYVG